MEQKTVLITGSRSGIGWCLAQRLAEQSHRVIATARTADQVEIMRNDCPKLFFPFALDVTQDRPETWADELQRVAKVEVIDTLVVNAAIHIEHDHDYPDVAFANWPHGEIREKTWATNYFGALKTVEAFKPLVKASTDGRILFVGGNLGSFGWHHHPQKSFRDMLTNRHPEYSASKVALNMAMVHLARNEPNLFVASLNPGWLDTKVGGKPKGNMKPRPVETAMPHFLKYSVGEIDRSRSGSFIDTRDQDVPWLDLPTWIEGRSSRWVFCLFGLALARI